MSDAQCTNLLREMELAEPDGEDSLEDNLERFQIPESDRVRRTLLDEFLECETECEERPKVQSKEKKNQKWGPTLQTDRPRRYAVDGKSALEKAEKYVKKKNLELTATKIGNSFATLDTASLI